MPKKLVIDDFTGGRNTLDSVDLISSNQHSAGDNVWCESKALSKRSGFTRVASSPDAGNINSIPEQIFPTNLNNQFTQIIVGRVAAHSQRYLQESADGNSYEWLYYHVGTASTGGVASTTITGSGTAWLTHVSVGDYFVRILGASPNRITAVNSDTEIIVTTNETITAGSTYVIIQAISSARPASHVSFDVSGVQNAFVCDGSRVLRVEGVGGVTNSYRADVQYSMPAFKYMVVFKNYIFGVGHNTTDIRWCAIKDATSWPSNNFQTVTSLSDAVRGIKVYSDSIIIMTRYRIFRFLGDTFDPATPTYVLEPIAVPNDFLFTFPRTMVEHLGTLKFLANNGWYSYSGGSGIDRISDPIRTDVDSFKKLPYEDEAMSDSAVSYVWKDRMWCSVCDNANTPANVLNSIYVLDEKNKWWRWGTAQVTTAGEISDFGAAKFGASGSFILKAGNVSTNKILTLDSGDSDNDGTANAINGNWTSREFVFPEESDIIECVVYMKKQTAGNLTFSVSLDRATFIDFTCDMTTGVGTVIKKRIPIGRTAKAIRVKVANNTAAQTFEIYKIEIVHEASEGVRI